jgi:hypothetical protein
MGFLKCCLRHLSFSAPPFKNFNRVRFSSSDISAIIWNNWWVMVGSWRGISEEYMAKHLVGVLIEVNSSKTPKTSDFAVFSSWQIPYSWQLKYGKAETFGLFSSVAAQNTADKSRMGSHETRSTYRVSGNYFLDWAIPRYNLQYLLFFSAQMQYVKRSVFANAFKLFFYTTLVL